MEAGGSKFGCGFGSSGPKILGLRLTFARLFAGRAESLIFAELGVLMEMEGVLDESFVFDRWALPVCGEVRGVDISGVTGGGVGEAALVRAFFAFLVLNFSSSSEEVTSESLVPWSTLMDVESRLLREPAPKDGARFSGRLVPANESERMIR